jgi:NADH dehydrogenase
MARLMPVLPLIGAETRFQPVYVDDVAAAAVAAVVGDPAPGVYELGGPEVATFRALMQRMLGITRRRRLLVAMPWGLAGAIASFGDFVQRLTRGLVSNGLVTRDQVRLLRRDNVAAPGARGLAELGVEPTAMEAVLENYLYVYRPSGQYTEIKESASRLRA